MAKNLLVLMLASAFLFSCAKKKKVDETPAAPTDTAIQAQDMIFTPQGSDSGQIEGLFTVTFPFDKSALTDDARAKLQKNADWMKAHPELNVQIEGHCDRWGSIEYNLGLGERRANATKDYLVNLGIPGSRLSTISYGKEKPLDPAETEAADGKNRRANFVVQK